MFKVVLTGGGTGGHFYPLMAVAEELPTQFSKNKLQPPTMYYMGPTSFDEEVLRLYGIVYIPCPAAKIHRIKELKYIIENIFNVVQVIGAVVVALVRLFRVYPDVVFSKGGYAAFPVVCAAKILGVPVVIHESDTTFGRTNNFTLSFAEYITLGFEELFNLLTKEQKEKAAVVGIPIRKALFKKNNPNAFDILKIDPNKKTILVLGGSQGSEFINDTIVDILPELLQEYQIVHQVGLKNIKNMRDLVKSIFPHEEGLKGYYLTDFFDQFHLCLAYQTASLVITRAGSGVLFEIAEWGIPTLIIPIPQEISHDQTKNAYAFARMTHATVVEQPNVTKDLMLFTINKILTDSVALEKSIVAMQKFARRDSAEKIASVIAHIAKNHE
ncbi:MAG: glycosyltransferase [Alphaproteobacteria bacterium]|nr:glycosyltransferase [Alphaproteobacteria bacterium]